ncbi:hypothetical protein FGRMN_1826 [Fusarium graminum]|nr:hypothetical protein FGRMN_1826 [Fusarium graminum]
MVSLKAIAVAYAAANLLGVDAGLCRPSSRTSFVSASTSASSAIPSDTTTSKDVTLSTDGTTATNPTTSAQPSLSTSETLSQPTSSGNPTTFEVSIVSSSTIATSSNPTVSVDSTTSGSVAASSDATTSADTTTAAESTTAEGTTAADTTTAEDTTPAESTTAGADTTTSAGSMIVDTTTAADTTAATGSTTVDTTITADTTTAEDTTTADTTTADVTTTSAEPTTTTSVCVEPTNLLRQPGFEPSDNQGAWGFYTGGGSVQVDSQHARTGDGLAVIPVPDGQERRMEQRIHIVPDTEYSIKFYYAVDNPPSVNTQCFLFATFDYYTTLAQVPLPSDTAYHMYEASFISSADNLDPVIEIGISCPTANNGYTATIYIDDASVLDTTNACDATPGDPDAPPKSTLLIPAEPEAPQCPVNVVKVPGFEPVNGNQGWVFYNRGEFVQDESNARTGEWEALLPSGTQTDAIYLEQRFSAQELSAGEIYDYRFFWKPNTLPNNGRCYISGGYNDAVSYTAAEVKSGATSSTGYTGYTVRFSMPSGSLLLQIIFYCDYYNGNSQLGSVFVDDTALIKVGGCDAYPVTGALIENPSFEIRATEDSTYAWFGTKGMSIKAGNTANGPSPRTDNNYLYVQLESGRRSATLTKPLARTLNAGQSYSLEFYYTAGPDFTPDDCSLTVAFGSATQILNLADAITPYDYQLLQATFTPGQSVKFMTLTLSCTSTEPDFAFDDFSLQ